MEFQSKILNIDHCCDAQHNLQVIRFEKPKEFTFEPGQFIMIACKDFSMRDNPCQLKWSSFSIASAPHQPFIELCIRVLNTPGLTHHLGTTKQIGDLVELKGPWGTFKLNPNYKELVLVALGTGIAPLISMVRHQLAKKDSCPIHLFYGFRTHACFVYETELKQLQTQHKNFHLHAIASDDNSQGKQGYVQTLLETAKFSIPTSEISVYLCGAPKIIDIVINYMKTLGFKEENLFKEKWG